MYDCSHTADTHGVVMKGATCYKDASEHGRYCNVNSGAHVQGGGQLDLTSIDDSIQVLRPVESAWSEHSSSSGCQPHSWW